MRGLLLILLSGMLVRSLRCVDWYMLCVIVPCFLGLRLFGLQGGSMFRLLLFIAEDLSHWPYSVGILVKWSCLLWHLHWPVGGAELAVGGVSYVEMLILHELWAGERALPRYQRTRAPNFSVGCSVCSTH